MAAKAGFKRPNRNHPERQHGLTRNTTRPVCLPPICEGPRREKAFNGPQPVEEPVQRGVEKTYKITDYGN